MRKRYLPHDEQQRFRRACAYAQSRQSLYYSQTNSVDLEEASGKKSCTWSYQMVAHEYLKNDKSDNQKKGPGFVSCQLIYYFHTSRRMHKCSDKDIYEGVSKSFEPNMERARNLDLFCFIFQRSPLPTPHTCPI